MVVNSFQFSLHPSPAYCSPLLDVDLPSYRGVTPPSSRKITDYHIDSFFLVRGKSSNNACGTSGGAAGGVRLLLTKNPVCSLLKVKKNTKTTVLVPA